MSLNLLLLYTRSYDFISDLLRLKLNYIQLFHMDPDNPDAIGYFVHCQEPNLVIVFMNFEGNCLVYLNMQQHFA